MSRAKLVSKRGLQRSLAWVVLLILLAIALEPAMGQGKGNGRYKIKPWAELDVDDGSIAAFNVDPSSADPGPRAFSLSDGFQWSGGNTNVRSVVFLSISQAENSASQSTVTVQGTAHEVSSWIFARQDSAATFGQIEATGVYDASAGDYTAPGGFTKDSQGTITITTYSTSSPPDGGSANVLNWIYDSGSNEYMFDAADKDFTNANGEETVRPITKKGTAGYALTLLGNTYGVQSVASAGQDYVPTLALGWERGESVSSGGETYVAYMLLDLPSGTKSDTYSYTVQATIHRAK